MDAKVRKTMAKNKGDQSGTKVAHGIYSMGIRVGLLIKLV